MQHCCCEIWSPKYNWVACLLEKLKRIQPNSTEAHRKAYQQNVFFVIHIFRKKMHFFEHE